MPGDSNNNKLLWAGLIPAVAVFFMATRMAIVSGQLSVGGGLLWVQGSRKCAEKGLRKCAAGVEQVR